MEVSPTIPIRDKGTYLPDNSFILLTAISNIVGNGFPNQNGRCTPFLIRSDT